jgi:hypothetical protein
VILSCVYLKLTDQTRCRRYQQVDEVVIGRDQLRLARGTWYEQ